MKINTRNHLYLMPLMLCLALLLWAHADTVETLDVVLDNNYPPYVFYDSENKLQGILIDEWALFGEKTGIKVNLHAMDWSDALSGMEKGQYDVIDTIFKNPEREKLYEFTKPYVDIDVSIFFNKNISGINSIQSLRGFQVAAKRGDQAVSELEAAGIESITLFDSYEAIVAAAAKNQVVVFVIDNPPARYFLYKYGLQEQFANSTPLYTGQFHRAVKLKDSALISRLESGFSKITRKERQAIQDKWFGKTSAYSAAFRNAMIIAIAASFAIFLFLLIVNRTLQRTVIKKTAALTIALQDLQYSESKLQAVIGSLPDMVFILSADGVIQDYLSSHEEGLMAPRSQFIGYHLNEFFTPELVVKFEKAINQVILGINEPPVEYNLNMPEPRHYEARFEPLNDHQAIAIVRDITQRHQDEQTIRQLSIMDLPTGLFNRNYFEEQLNLLRNSSILGLSIMMVDFDGLKLVNDTLGHNTGDFYLKTVADLIKVYFQDALLTARIGGDEFVIILRNWPHERILACKTSLNSAILKLNEDNHTIPFSLSIGFATASDEETTIEELLKIADDFMYREKIFHRQSLRSRNIDTLSTMLEERDFITEGHGERMGDLAISMARHLSFEETEVEAMSLFAQFHDIGKIGISDTILFKPDRLTQTEYQEMKRHAEIGFRIAESSPELMHISEWIYKHHEWWDGSGYPFGLKGDDIPMACRILALVDAYDAMTNNRPYRNAMSQSDAIKELRKNSGKQFDPNLVEIFISLITDYETLKS